jgi:hypothetical protein
MRKSTMTVAVAGIMWFLSNSVIADSWILPHGIPVKDTGHARIVLSWTTP